MSGVELGNRQTDGVVAQMVERLLCKQNVVGSIPSGSTRELGFGEKKVS